MAIGAAEIDEIVVAVSADVKQYIRALNEAEKKTQTWTTAMGVIIGNFASRAFAMAGNAIKNFLFDSVRVASEANESLSAFQQVFGEQANAAAKAAEDLAKRVGRSATDIKGQLTSQQAFFVGMGFAKDRARELSLQIQELAIDLASFRNLSDEDTINRFRSALSGSSEVLDQFGINIKISALEQEALSQGIKKSVNQMTEQEKVMLRIAIIAKSLGAQGAIGDAERTAGQFANQVRTLSADWKEFKATIGALILPSLSAVIDLVNKAAKAVNSFADAIVFMHAKWREPPAPLETKLFNKIMEDMGEDNLKVIDSEIENLRGILTSTRNMLGMGDAESAEAQLAKLKRVMDAITLLENEREVMVARIAEAEQAERAAAENQMRVWKNRQFLIQNYNESLKTMIDLLDKAGRSLRIDTRFGKHGLIGRALLGAGGFLNFFKDFEEAQKQGSERFISNTGGQAVFGGTSEAIRLTQIGQTRVSENEKRDKLLEKANSTLTNIHEGIKNVVTGLRDAGIDVEVIGVP